MLGAVLVVHSGLVLFTARHLPASFSTPTATPGPTATTTAPSVRGRAPVPVRSHRAIAVPVFVPIRLRIPGLGVDARAVAATSAARTLAPPKDPSRVGWWIASALPGSARGTTVVVGHIDSAATGPGALFHLDQVRAGQTIELAGTRDATSYRVVSLQFYAKTTGLPAALFAPGGSSRLVVISCGGTFDAAKRSYRDNVVVTAVPVG